MERIKRLLVLNWRQKAAARSQLKLAIEDALESGLPRAYTPEAYQQKCAAVFEHVYESFPSGTPAYTRQRCEGSLDNALAGSEYDALSSAVAP